MSNPPGPLGQRIAAELRAELGRQNKSRRWLGEQIGQSHVTVSRWLNAEGPMSLDALDAICHALGVTPADLIRRAESQPVEIPAPRPPRSRRSAVGVGGRERPTPRRTNSGSTPGFVFANNIVQSQPVTEHMHRAA